ncbi:MAG: SsrA-binding protein SmpB [Bacilli bacterium]|nr:SsrA-binding protein SmpB [Bacilli bacterium]
MNKMDGIKILVNNSKAKYLYFLEDFLECGIELKGSEIKSIRKNGASLTDSYIVIKNDEAFILNMHIAPYEHGNSFNHEPNRTRKLLLHKNEILKMGKKAKEKVMTIVPTKVYLKKGKVKVEIALAKGKKLYDKRETIKKRDDERMMAKMKKGFEKQ